MIEKKFHIQKGDNDLYQIYYKDKYQLTMRYKSEAQIVVDYTSDFTNDLDLRTNQVVEQNISMDIKLKMDGIKWLMIG